MNNQRQLQVGDQGEVWVNQGYRDYAVLAVLDDRALIEYEMPNGREFLTEVSSADVEARFDRPAVWIQRQRKRLPKRWKDELERLEVEPENDPVMENHLAMKGAGLL